MWVSRTQWETVHDRLNIRRDEASRLQDCVTILERRLATIEERTAAGEVLVTGGTKDLLALAERVSKVEKQVIPSIESGAYYWLTTAGPMVLSPSTKSVTLLQKVNLLLDHLKLRVQPEGTTPPALVKTGAKKR